MTVSSVKTGAVGISFALDNNYMEPIATTLVGSGGVNSITFNDIPQTYKHLQIRAINRNDRAVPSTGSSIYIKMNNDSNSSNYRTHRTYGDGSSVYSDSPSGSTNGGVIAESVSNGTTNNSFGGAIIDILDYTNKTKYKTVRCLSGCEFNDVNGNAALFSCLWINTETINSLTFNLGNHNMMQHSRFSLYGIKG